MSPTWETDRSEEGNKKSISLSVWSGLWEDGCHNIEPDSLGLPAEFCAELQDWLQRYSRRLDLPDYVGRVAYDDEGRALAGKLQQLLGDKIAVKYRRWVEFDPAKWQTRWWEERLDIGEGKEFWLREDLPDDVVVKVVRIYPDCGGSYLWDLDGCCIGNEEPAFSDDLDKRFAAWSESWDACFNTNTFKI